jgi:hypothetical protein
LKNEENILGFFLGFFGLWGLFWSYNFNLQITSLTQKVLIELKEVKKRLIWVKLG